jgi:hypothetical protein
MESALLIHEYILTFVNEVERFWPKWLRNFFDFKINLHESPNYRERDEIMGNDKNGFTWASLFFLLNRYLSIFGHIPVMIQYFWRFNENLPRDMVRPWEFCHDERCSTI